MPIAWPPHVSSAPLVGAQYDDVVVPLSGPFLPMVPLMVAVQRALENAQIQQAVIIRAQSHRVRVLQFVHADAHLVPNVAPQHGQVRGGLDVAVIDVHVHCPSKQRGQADKRRHVRPFCQPVRCADQDEQRGVAAPEAGRALPQVDFAESDAEYYRKAEPAVPPAVGAAGRLMQNLTCQVREPLAKAHTLQR